MSPWALTVMASWRRGCTDRCCLVSPPPGHHTLPQTKQCVARGQDLPEGHCVFHFSARLTKSPQTNLPDFVNSTNSVTPSVFFRMHTCIVPSSWLMRFSSSSCIPLYWRVMSRVISRVPTETNALKAPSCSQHKAIRAVCCRTPGEIKCAPKLPLVVPAASPASCWSSSAGTGQRVFYLESTNMEVKCM